MITPLAPEYPGSALQSANDVEPFGATVCKGQSKHSEEPFTGAYVLSKQTMHKIWPALLQVPASHSAGAGIAHEAGGASLGCV